jgi:N-acetylmuramoyl-L-alanine amidase
VVGPRAARTGSASELEPRAARSDREAEADLPSPTARPPPELFARSEIPSVEEESPTPLPTVFLPTPSPRPTRSPAPTSAPRTVVIDPGHGGKDPGAQGYGPPEKDVTLAIAKLIAEKLAESGDARVVLTRTDDRFVSLEERTATANAEAAELFVSIHANASESPTLGGIETYTLNNTDDQATIRLAALENGLTLAGAKPGEQDLAYILSDLVQTGKEDESVLLARAVQRDLVRYLRGRWKGVTDLGVKKGPFYVLVGAYMPCALVEIGFLTHEVEGPRIGTERYQRDLAEGIARGIQRFFAAPPPGANL